MWIGLGFGDFSLCDTIHFITNIYWVAIGVHIGKAWQQRREKNILDTVRKQGTGRSIFILKWILENVNLLKHIEKCISASISRYKENATGKI